MFAKCIHAFPTVSCVTRLTRLLWENGIGIILCSSASEISKRIKDVVHKSLTAMSHTSTAVIRIIFKSVGILYYCYN